MIRNRLPYSVLLFVVSITACRRDSEPPPRVAMSGLGLIPVRASDVVVDPGMLAAAATEESARAAAAAQPAAAPVVDDSTPEGLAKSYVDLINSGQVTQLATLLITDQQAIGTESAPVIQPLLEANAKLHRLLTEKFSGHAFQIGLTHELLPPDWLRRWTVATVTPDAADANSASAALQEDGGTQTATKTLKKIDEHWRIEETGLPPSGSAAQAGAALAPIAEALQAVVTQIESNQLTDPQQAEAAIKQALSGQPAPSAAAAPAQPQPAAAKANSAAQKPKNSDRPKSEIEQDMDGAAQRSVLGGGI